MPAIGAAIAAALCNLGTDAFGKQASLKTSICHPVPPTAKSISQIDGSSSMLSIPTQYPETGIPLANTISAMRDLQLKRDRLSNNVVGVDIDDDFLERVSTDAS